MIRSPLASRCGHLAIALTVAAGLAACTSPTGEAGPGAHLPPEPRPSIAHPCKGVPRGSITSHHIDSTAMHRVERYRIYQPPGTTARDQLRLLILLHGASADETQWLDVGIASAADCMTGRGEPLRTVIVLVDGSLPASGPSGGTPAVDRLVVDEILPAVRRRYPNLAGRDGTGIGGISLGGGQAFAIAAHHPNLFGAVGGHSPASNLTDNQIRALAAHDVRAWTDVGRSDPLQTPVHDLSTRLQDANIAVMSMQWPGRHDRRYWSQHTEEYLRFYAQLW